MKYLEITEKDRQLVQAAVEVVTKHYREERHTVGAAVLCASGKIYTGVNVESVGYGPCAEPIAIGAAFSSGEKEFDGRGGRPGRNHRLPGYSAVRELPPADLGLCAGSRGAPG